MNDFIENRPQRLCKACGRCCRCAISPFEHGLLEEMAKENVQNAVDFLKIFEPYPSIEDARNFDCESVNTIIERLKNAGKYNEEKLTFYHCRHIQENNFCGIYEQRPEFCKAFPINAWDVGPPGCGFDGWLFIQREKIKKSIRKKKERLIELEVQLESAETSEKAEKIKSLMYEINKLIKSYEKHGSKNW